MMSEVNTKVTQLEQLIITLLTPEQLLRLGELREEANPTKVKKTSVKKTSVKKTSVKKTSVKKTTPRIPSPPKAKINTPPVKSVPSKRRVQVSTLVDSDESESDSDSDEDVSLVFSEDEDDQPVNRRLMSA